MTERDDSASPPPNTLDYEPPPRSTQRDRSISVAALAVILGLFNLVWVLVAQALLMFRPPWWTAGVTMIFSGMMPTAIIGVLMALIGNVGRMRWAGFLANAFALLIATFIILFGLM